MKECGILIPLFQGGVDRNISGIKSDEFDYAKKRQNLFQELVPKNDELQDGS